LEENGISNKKVVVIIVALLATSAVSAAIPLGFSDFFSREVYLDGVLRVDGADYTGGMWFNTGGTYELMLAGFQPSGSVSVYLQNTVVASEIALNSTGGASTDITIPSVSTGNYFFRVIDNLSVEYNFKIHVLMVPYIVCSTDTGNVADAFTVTGVNFLDYVGDSVTIYFENSQAPPYYTLLWNGTITTSTWSVDLVVPQSWGGERHVEARTIDGTVTITYDVYTVLPKITVIPDVIDNTAGQIVQVIGTGFYTGMVSSGGYVEDYFFYIDNSMYFGDDEDWSTAINQTGYVLTEFVAAGFRPGLHAVHVIGDGEGTTPWTVVAEDTFVISTVGDPIVGYLESINAAVVSISDGMATLETAMGETTVSLAQLDAKIVALDGTVATLKTRVGTVETTLDDLDVSTTVTDDDIVRIETSIGTIEGKITDMEGTLATVETELGNVKIDVADAKTDLSSMESNVGESVWIVAVFALIVAIVSLVGVFFMQRKLKP
jgi:hypothetical protein